MDWLDFLHIADSSFPTGAYAHSGGLEALQPADLRMALELRVRCSLATFELVFVRAAYNHDLAELDERYHATCLPRELREASMAIGASLARAAADVGFHTPPMPHKHYAVVFGALACVVHAQVDVALQAFAFSTLRGHVSAAQKLGWLGQREAQRVLHALKPLVRQAVQTELPLEHAGAFVPLWDIASMQHEQAHTRLFMS